MNRYAVVCGDTIVNAILWDGETPYEPGENCTTEPMPEGVHIGWLRDAEGNWSAPPAPEQTDG